MSRTLLWLWATLAFASLISQAHGSEMKVMSAPNLLRVGTIEKIFVECQDCSGANKEVRISVMNHPTKSSRLASTSVTLTSADKFQGIGEIEIPAEGFSRDPTVKQYVYLQAHFPDKMLEKVVLVSFQSGYIYIQTDKPLYTPNSRVHYRMFVVTPGMEPVERDSSIDIEIKTPEGIIFPVDTVSPNSGIHSGDYQLAEIVSTGVWNVVAKFHTNPQQTFSAEFEVKEYVLPSFEVKIIPLSSFFYVDSPTLTIKIQAKYLFGEDVYGTAYVVFGVVHEGQRKSFPDSVQKVEIDEGTGGVILKREHITQSFKMEDLVGCSMFVAVSVLTENGGEMVEAELRGIQIVTSPYTIHFKKTPKYFKPGMSFDVAVEVLNPDDTPAKFIPVLVGPGDVQGITGANGMAKVTVNTGVGAGSLTVTANTADPQISLERQASATMTALPYKSTGNNYIHIGVDTAELQLGNNLKISLNLNRQAAGVGNDITYLIVSRSQLVSHGRYTTQGNVLISLIVSITKDMLPSFRIIAYYHTDANEVVSDSVWVDVKDTCMGSLKLQPSRPANSYEPRDPFDLKVTGDPGATVGLVAVDKGVYVLNNKFRLTQKRVWDLVEKYDTGCTPGGGKDSMGVFYDAGLLFESSIGSGTGPGTPYRQESNCPKEAPKRRKRSDTIMSVITSLLSRYETEKQRECCLDGIRETPLSYSCERRSQYITDGQACVDAFLNCCNSILTQTTERREEELQLARSEADDDSYMDSNDFVSRTQFPESWLWTDLKLGPCPPNTPSCKTITKVKNVPLPDSITTWQFTGISLSRNYGICVGESLEVIVRKEFFIDLRVPYSAVRGEQLEIKAILHNYSPKPVTVRVDLLEEEHVCSSASKRSKYRQEVKVLKDSSRSVSFVIIPMKEGIVNIEVKAAVKNSALHDGVRKPLRVVPEGVLIKTPTILTLDPVKNGTNGKQVEVLNSGIQRKDLVPNTPTSTQISVTGREQISAVVEDAISGKSMGNMIYQPSGCGEQNMIHMTMPVIATLYLDKTNQWETVGFQRREEALKHIRHGYQRELAYRKTDGSYAAFPHRQSSSWLTAYVAKVFAMANTLVAVQKDIICSAVKYVILNGQQPDGMFKEDGTVIHGEMMGDVRGSTDSDASMTAFCLIALQETRTLCSDTVNSLQTSIAKAVAFLEKRLPKLTNPYAVAIAAYGLANEEKFNKESLYRFVSSELTHWPVPKGHVYTMEATGYALLALVRAKALEEARPVVRWLNKQQRVGRGYGSTQATIIVYQAVAEYWAVAKEPEYNLDVDILVQGRSKPDSYNFNNENHFATRTSKISDINQNVTVTATGTGEATVTLVSLYYAIPKEKESDCRTFNLSVQLIPEKEDQEEKVYRLKIEYFYKDDARDAGMSILDIGLLTGFTVNTNDLNRLAKGPSQTISRYEMNKALSERGSLIIYLKSVSHTQTEEVAFRIHQTLKVGVLQPAAVSIYEYYEQKHCVKFYHPERRAGHLMRLCRNDECTCAEENCSMQKKENVDNEQRIAKSCESTPTSKIDYVYKVRVEKYTDGVSTDFYTMLVLDSIKEGNLDIGPRGKSRIFLGYPHCKEALDLRVGNTYLIMGTSKDIYRDTESKTFQYVLGERTWVEYWPTNEECQNEEHRDTCVGMQKMVQVYQIKGCNE